MVAKAENSVQAPSPAASKVVNTLDRTSDIIGKVTAVLILPMMVVLGYEVISRYYFNAPTIWAGDIALILYGIYFMLGSPYCLKEGMHIRTDFLYHRWSTKTKGLVDTITYLFLYIPTHVIFLEIAWKYFFKSFQQGEVIISSPWMPIIWPMKLAIPVSIVLMLMQGLSETIKSYHAWRYGEFFWGDPGESKDDPVKICEPQIQ